MPALLLLMVSSEGRPCWAVHVSVQIFRLTISELFLKSVCVVTVAVPSFPISVPNLSLPTVKLSNEMSEIKK